MFKKHQEIRKKLYLCSRYEDNDAKQYAETQNLTVDEFVVSLIKNARREQFYQTAANLINLGFIGELELYATPLSYATLR